MKKKRLAILAGVVGIGAGALLLALQSRGEQNAPSAESSPSSPKVHISIAREDPPYRRFTQERPLREQLVHELSTLYEGGSPNLYPELKTRREEAGPILLEILRDPTVLRAAAKQIDPAGPVDRMIVDNGRGQAAGLLVKMAFPGTLEALITVAGEDQAPAGVYYWLGRKGGAGAAGAIAVALGKTTESDPRIRFMIEGLGYTGDRAGLPALETIINGVFESYLRKRADCSRQAILLANAPKMVEKALQILSSQNPQQLYGSSPDAIGNYALLFLRRANPPKLSERLRSIMDAEKRRKKQDRNAWWEQELLSALGELGEPLSPTELKFLAAWDRGGCVSPPASPPD